MIVLNEIAQMAVLFLADWRFQRNRILCNADDLLNPLHRHFQTLCDLLRGRVMSGFMEQLAGCLFHLGDGLHHVHRNADSSRLIGNGTGDGLPNPPSSIGRELEPLVIVELFHSFQQTEVALLNQIQKLHTTSHELFGDADHQTEVCLAKTLFGIGVALCHALCQLLFLLHGQQGNTADLLEVDLDGVVNGNAVCGEGGFQIIHI